MTRWTDILCMILIAAATQCAVAQANPRELLTSALDEYRSALDNPNRTQRMEGFRHAHLLFQKAADTMQDPTADLLANLGNAAAQSQQPGQAIAAYRRALRVEPNHRRARANLAVIRSQLPEWVRYQEPSDLFDSLFFWNRLASPRSISRLAAGFFVLASILIAASIRWQQPLLRNLAVLPAVAWLILLGSTAGEWPGGEPEGVVTADETVGRSADSATAAAKFTSPLPSGTEVTILETRDAWTQIEFANAQTAWVLTSGLERLDP